MPLAVYVHTPFCPSKCGYCDFNSYAMEGEIIGQTVDGIVQEILMSPYRGRPAKTIFFGGGTPTFLEAHQLARILDTVREVHPPVEGCEITSEANPGTVDIPKFEAMVRAGFNRISLGAQSFQSEDLLRLGRVHAPGHIGKAVLAAREAGFQNLNLDLMFALPGQSHRGWEKNLEFALSLRPDHLSLYCLTIEANTRFYRLWLRGMLDLPDDDAQIAMYDHAIETCAAAGLAQYEISNFARPGMECQHNLCYWRAEEYAAYGPGAVGRVGDTRYTVAKHPNLYVQDPGAWCDSEPVDGVLESERVMLGLRLVEGISAAGLDASTISRLAGAGLLEPFEGRIRLTRRGQHLANSVISDLMP